MSKVKNVAFFFPKLLSFWTLLFLLIISLGLQAHFEVILDSSVIFLIWVFLSNISAHTPFLVIITTYCPCHNDFN